MFFFKWQFQSRLLGGSLLIGALAAAAAMVMRAMSGGQPDAVLRSGLVGLTVSASIFYIVMGAAMILTMICLGQIPKK